MTAPWSIVLNALDKSVRTKTLLSSAPGAQNWLAVFVDPDNGPQGGSVHGSGWWYEGGGIYRHVRLVRANPVHIAQEGLFAYSANLSGPIHGSTRPASGGQDGGPPGRGAVGSLAVLRGSVDVVNEGRTAAPALSL